jgi:PAS domain S-box-containing protein
MQALAERASVGIYLALGFRILYANACLCEMTGYTREALLAMEDAVAALFVPDQQDRIRAYGQARLRGDPAPSVYAARIVRADGAELLVELAVSTLEIEGTVLSQGTVLDISERARMARALREQEAAFHALLDASTEGAALLDPAGRVLAANAVLADRLGCPLDELLGQLIWPHFPRPIRDRRRAALEEVVRSRQAVRHVDARQDRTFDTQICPVFDPSGTVTRVAVFARDITEQSAAEQASEEAHQALVRRNRDLIVLNRVAAILARSLDLEAALGTVLDHIVAREDTDAASLLLLEGIGGGAPLVLARSGADPLPPSAPVPDRPGSGRGAGGGPTHVDSLARLCDQADFLDYVGAARAQLAATGRAILFCEHDDLSASLAVDLARAGYAHLACMPVPVGGEVSGTLVLLARDRLRIDEGTLHTLSAIAVQVGWAVENARLAALTAEVHVREELGGLQARLLADVSHEFRTPLGLIRSASQSLRSANVRFRPEVRDRLLQIVEDETDRLEALVENLLLVARTEERPLELHRRRVDLTELARAAVARLAPLLSESATLGNARLSHIPERGRPGHPFTIYAPSEPVLAWADPAALARVFSNLLSNAVQYSPHGGAITIDIVVANGDALVRVRDQGIGIGPEHLERIFQRFYRAPSAPGARQAGVGLGLSVCKTLVEAHGGDIWVESRPGHGSTFTFTVPLADQEDLAKASRTERSTPSHG